MTIKDGGKWQQRMKRKEGGGREEGSYSDMISSLPGEKKLRVSELMKSRER